MNANFKLEFMQTIRGLPLHVLIQIYLHVKLKKLEYYLKGK